MRKDGWDTTTVFKKMSQVSTTSKRRRARNTHVCTSTAAQGRLLLPPLPFTNRRQPNPVKWSPSPSLPPPPTPTAPLSRTPTRWFSTAPPFAPCSAALHHVNTVGDRPRRGQQQNSPELDTAVIAVSRFFLWGKARANKHTNVRTHTKHNRKGRAQTPTLPLPLQPRHTYCCSSTRSLKGINGRKNLPSLNEYVYSSTAAALDPPIPSAAPPALLCLYSPGGWEHSVEVLVRERSVSLVQLPLPPHLLRQLGGHRLPAGAAEARLPQRGARRHHPRGGLPRGPPGGGGLPGGHHGAGGRGLSGGHARLRRLRV